MEFYNVALNGRKGDRRFQFPTGWNSTKNPCDFVELPKFEFQFPTGWNSTLPLVDRANFLESFNSQRDGILRFFGTAD